MTTDYPPWTFGACLRAIARNQIIHDLPELRGLRDNIAGDHLLVIDVADVAARDRWAEWFGGATRAARSPREPAYVDGWHGWTVAIWPDSPETPGQAASAVESPPPDQADTDDEDDDRPAVLVPCQRRIVGDPHGSHTHEQSTGETVLCIGYQSRQAVAAAVLTPDDPALPAEEPEPDPARVIMGQSMSRCSVCGGNADPNESAHIHGGPESGWRDGSSLADRNGCGVVFEVAPENPYARDGLAEVLPGSAMCRVPHVRTGDGPSIVARCTRRAGHDGDHVDTHNRQWANEYVDAAVNV